jgi:C4-dicarboxylate-specific signal transduction histidine kinase
MTHVSGPLRREAPAQIAVPEYFQRKRMEEALRASHAELEARVRERTEELARANRALQAEIAERKREEEERRLLERQIQHAQKLESLGVLAGGIAHDFNNLLVGILGNAGLALMRLAPDDPTRPTVEAIHASAMRAAELTKQMLAYSGRGKFVVQPVSLTDVVAEMSELLGASITKKAAVEFDFAPDLPPIEADATQIRQVVMNLITNASEAIGEGSGRITLRTGVVRADRALFASTHLDDDLPEGDYAFMEVADTGCGMDEETRAKIFDPFFTTKFMGRGLGLAAVLGIVRGHRGTIRVTSAPGEGTTVSVYLPAIRS